MRRSCILRTATKHFVHATGHAKESVSAGRSHRVRKPVHTIYYTAYRLLAAAEVLAQPPILGVAGRTLSPTCHRPGRTWSIQAHGGSRRIPRHGHLTAAREPLKTPDHDGDPLAPTVVQQSECAWVLPSSSFGSPKAKSSDNLASIYTSHNLFRSVRKKLPI